MASIDIDSKTYTTTVLTFSRLKKAWPLIVVASTNLDPIENMEAAIGLVSLTLEENHPDCTPEWLENNIRSTDLPRLRALVEAILKENELTPDRKNKQVGNGAGAAPSTGTSTKTLPNLLPQDAAAETGLQ